MRLLGETLEAITHAVSAGKLRAHLRRNGETGMGGLARLADRHSALSSDYLCAVAGISAWANGPAKRGDTQAGEGEF